MTATRPALKKRSAIDEQLREQERHLSRRGPSRTTPLKRCPSCQVTCWGETRAIALDLWFAHQLREHWGPDARDNRPATATYEEGAE